MAEPYLAEVRIFGFNFPPRGWAKCDGQLLPISQNQSLFSLIGTFYGGDGRTDFALPDLRGRTPVHVGQGVSIGERAGEEAQPLGVAEMPAHSHTVMASPSAADVPVPAGNVLADTAPAEVYHDDSARVDMRAGTVADTGSGQGHPNMQPFTTLNFCIAIQGLFPPRN